jgi:opacity protein-like surface antigen
MKKTILFIACALMTMTGVFAQKQTGGEKNLEVAFAPLGGNPVSMSGIRLRLFNSEASAIRIGLFLGGSTTKDVTAQPEESGDPDQPELYSTSKSTDISLRPGYEKHFAGTDRLSPYVGAELALTLHSESTEDETWTQINADGDTGVATTTTKDGSTTFGLNILAGTDFYFADNIYLGAELGFGFQTTSNKDTETTIEGIDDAEDPDPLINGSNSAWGPNVQGTLRLGWLFN